jgi:hypothetical protein
VLYIERKDHQTNAAIVVTGKHPLPASLKQKLKRADKNYSLETFLSDFWSSDAFAYLLPGNTTIFVRGTFGSDSFFGYVFPATLECKGMQRVFVTNIYTYDGPVSNCHSISMEHGYAFAMGGSFNPDTSTFRDVLTRFNKLSN